MKELYQGHSRIIEGTLSRLFLILPPSELHLLPLLQPSQSWSSNQEESATQRKGKSCIEGAKYAVIKYLPPPSKMHGATFHKVECATNKKIFFLDFFANLKRSSLPGRNPSAGVVPRRQTRRRKGG